MSHETASHQDSHSPTHSGTPLTRTLLLILSFAGVEAVGGWWAGSLALLGDAGHMLTDATALGLAALAARLGQAAPSRRHSFGLGRLEVLTALANAAFMLALVGAIAWAAWGRLQAPQPVSGPTVMVIAAAGLVVNLIAVRMLHGHEHGDLNTRGALLHVLGDLLGSVAALVSGAVIWTTGWTPIDPLLSLLIGLLILYSSQNLLREAVHELLEGVPGDLDLREVGEAMASLPGVNSVHDLHIWRPRPGLTALAAHVDVPDLEAWPGVLHGLRQLLAEHYGIEHVTLQPETAGQAAGGTCVPPHCFPADGPTTIAEATPGEHPVGD